MRKTNREESVISAAVSPMIENLESRVLLSSVLKSGVLKITGGAGNDDITVQLSTSGTQILVQEGSSVKGFAKNKVKSINIVTGDGDDHVIINPGIKAPITIKVGAGVDQVHGGSGQERIFGGDGDDSLFGGGGSDYMQGDSGNDRVDGEAGNDYVYGDLGNDTLMGGDGNDVMAGDLENMLVAKGQAPRGGPTDPLNDSLDGGPGNDWFLSERRLIGVDPGPTSSPADDIWIFAENGRDTFIGGSGNDIIDIGANFTNSTTNDDTIVDEEPGDFVPMREGPAFSERPNSDDVHTHVTLAVKVRSGSRYKHMTIPANLGHFSTKFLSGLHTHARPTPDQIKLPPGANVIHYEAPPNSPAYSLNEFFRVAGISFNSKHIGRFLPPTGKKMTMWITRNGRTFQSKAFGKFIPNGHNIIQLGDTVEIRVG